MRYLLDVSSVLALLWENHLSHARVQAWARKEELAVCPITELGFLRISTQSFGADMDDARQSLSAWLQKRRPNSIPCDQRALAGRKAPTGGKTTDFYLAHLAEAHGMKLATLDEHIAHPAVFVIPKPPSLAASLPPLERLSFAGRAKGDSRVSKRRQFVVSKRRRAIKSGLLSEPLVWR